MLALHALTSVWPEMSADEIDALTEDVRERGLLVPITTWRGEIVDGKHRAIACDRAGVARRYDALDDELSLAKVIARVRSANNLCRRLTAGARAVIAVRCSALVNGAKDAAALRASLSRCNVARAQRVERVDPKLNDRVLTGELSLLVAERIAMAPEEQRDAMLARIDTAPRAIGVGDSWGTPPEWIEFARAVMGDIDCDPASNTHAQRTVQATTFYTIEDDGLAQEWRGRVWLNPPYSQPAVTLFADKLLAEVRAGRVTQACVLVNNATDTRFAQRLLAASCAVLFPVGRVSFVAPGGSAPIPGTRNGQMILYFGDDVAPFREAARGLGWVGETCG